MGPYLNNTHVSFKIKLHMCSTNNGQNQSWPISDVGGDQKQNYHLEQWPNNCTVFLWLHATKLFVLPTLMVPDTFLFIITGQAAQLICPGKTTTRICKYRGISLMKYLTELGVTSYFVIQLHNKSGCWHKLLANIWCSPHHKAIK